MAVVNSEQQTMPSLAPAAGLASAIAMGVVIGYNMSKTSGFTSTSSASSHMSNRGSVHRMNHFSTAPTRVRNRIYKTYAYFASSIGITGISAYCFFNYTRHSHETLMRMNKHPKWYLFTSLVASIGLLIGTKMTNYNRRPILKHLLWIAMHIHEGAFLSVLGFIGGPVIVKAAIYTAAILGGISLISASASDESVLKMGAFLGVGLGMLMGMSAIQFVYPAVGGSSTFQNVNIYGGLLIFGLQMAYDTKKVLIRAKELHKEYDPINQQMV